MQGAEQRVEVDQLVIYPDSMRQEVVLPQGTMVQVVTPSVAFMQTPMGSQPLPAARRESFAAGLQRTLPVILKAAVEGLGDARALEAGEVSENFVVLEQFGQLSGTNTDSRISISWKDYRAELGDFDFFESAPFHVAAGVPFVSDNLKTERHATDAAGFDGVPYWFDQPVIRQSRPDE